MKIHRILFVCAAIAIPQLTVAKLPFTNDTFGKIEGTLAFCAETDPKAAAKYKERVKPLVQGASEKELAEARQTKEYKEAFDWIHGELGKVPKAQAVKACTDFLDGKN
jgi:hypothetical protein